MSEGERRSAKLHKQPEVEDDEDDGLAVDDESGSVSGRSSATIIDHKMSGGVPTPTVQSASSSSGTSPDESQPQGIIIPPITRNKTLIRTQALEGTSPPSPDSFFSSLRPNGSVHDSPLLANGASGGNSDKTTKKTRHPSSHEAKEFLLASQKVSNDSGHGTMDTNDGGSDISVLSRDSSLDNNDIYKDSSGVDIIQFMKETLQKSKKDRTTVLQYENQMLEFISNENASTMKMAEMTSYDRMIIHRLAAFLGLEHNVDTTGKCVILNKTENTRKVRPSQLAEASPDQEPKKKILLKKPVSLDEKSRSGNKALMASHKAKSLEERQQHYSAVRDRIFKNEENQADCTGMAPTLLSANYQPSIPHQHSLDSMRSTGQHSKWGSTESSGYGMDSSSMRTARLRANMTKSHSYGGTVTTPTSPHLSLGTCGSVSLTRAESLKDSPNTQYSSPPIPHPSGQVPTPTMSLSDQSNLSRQTSESGPSPQAQQCPTSFAYLLATDYSSIPVGSLIINPNTMEPHVNADGSIYHFDPTCPPPFMLQAQPPPATPPTQNVVYATEAVSDLTNRLMTTSITPGEAPSESFPVAFQGPQMQVVPQQVYTHPAQFPQSQFYTAPSPTANPVRYVTFPVAPNQGQQLLQAAPVESQGQSTVPMPAIGLQPIPGTAGYQVVGPTYQQPVPGQPQCVDLNGGYYNPLQDTVAVSSAGAINGSSGVMAAPGTQHLVQAYSLPYSQQQQPAQQQHAIPHQPHHSSGASAQQFYSVPASSPTPPLSLSQPPPSSHHQPQHVYFNRSLTVSPLTYPVSVSNSSSTSNIKSIAMPFMPTYRPSTPPQLPQQQLIQHPTHPQQQVATSTNGHHPPQLTLNYGAPPVAFSTGQPPQGSILAIPQNPYQVQPLGVIQLGNQPVPSPQQVAGTPLQSYQLYRPTAPSDVRMVNRPRLPSLQITNPHNHPNRPRTANPRQPRKGGNKKSREAEQCTEVTNPPLHVGQGALMATPLIPNLSGPMTQSHSHLPSASSNRQ